MFEAFLNLPVPQRKIVREVILTFARVYPPEAVKVEGGADNKNRD